jgi:hypothetical protein
MGRRTKLIAALGMPSLREHWRDINRLERRADVEARARRKAKDKKRNRCRCDAYRWPHRPGGGLCRYPDPPAVRWQDAQAAEISARVAEFRRRWGEPSEEQMADLVALTTRAHRPYRKRYAGLVRQIARANGLHPIRDRAQIEAMMPRVLSMAKELKRQAPHMKYRSMEITNTGLTGHWRTIGPDGFD